MLDLLVILLGGIYSWLLHLQSYCTTVRTLKTFTLNHNTQSRCITLCTVLILHRVIPCNLTCALLAVLLVSADRTENVMWLLLLRVTSLRSHRPSLLLRDQVITE
jgi:hypothetical protein